MDTGSANTPRWLAIYLLASISLGVAFRWEMTHKKWQLGPLDGALALFVGYVALSLLWSSDWREGVLRVQNLSAVVVAGLLLFRYSSRPEWLCGLAAAAVGLYWWDTPGFGGFGNENFLTEWLAPLMPLAVWCAFQERWATKLMGIVASLAGLHYLILVCQSDTRFVALAVVVAVGAWWVWRKWHLFPALLILLVPVNIALLTGWVGGEELTRALNARLEMTHNTLVLWLEKPLFGHGVGSFNYEYPRIQEAHLAWFPNIDTLLRPAEVYVGAAHNEYVQVLSDFGLMGALLAGIIMAVIILRLVAWTTLSGAAVPAILGLGIMAGTALIGFPFQNPATSILPFALLGLVCAGRSSRP
jgi:O-antigen ligase